MLQPGETRADSIRIRWINNLPNAILLLIAVVTLIASMQINDRAIEWGFLMVVLVCTSTSGVLLDRLLDCGDIIARGTGTAIEPLCICASPLHFCN